MTGDPNPLSAPGTFPGLPPGSPVFRPARRRWLRRTRPEPTLWISDEPVDTPAAAHPEQPGLRAVLLHDRPGLEEWWAADVMERDAVSAPGDHDAEDVLRDYWHAVIADPEEGAEGEDLIAPFGRDWPGLAPAGRDPEAAGADALARELIRDGWFGRPRLALVPVGRGADVPAAIRWSGPVNHENDTARISAVLRSWEDRYGVRVLALGFDRLDLHVAAPPRTLAEAIPLAAEHFAFCPDNVWQGSGTVRDYAQEALVGSDHWSFWWD
uniref:DUF4253 domain-containing protein n=1 Tax=Streptomyces sp. NBC_00049 TaxID=2903617 RepID=A0AAU2JR21_9ACTN